MATTEGRVARPERRWGCRRGTPVWMHLFAKKVSTNLRSFDVAMTL